jgi:hypothetical protein
LTFEGHPCRLIDSLLMPPRDTCVGRSLHPRWSRHRFPRIAPQRGTAASPLAKTKGLAATDLPRFSAPRRTRTYNPLIKSPLVSFRNARSVKPLRISLPTLAPSLPLGADLPPDLAAVVDAWAELPEPVRLGIVAMVKASRKGNKQR